MLVAVFVRRVAERRLDVPTAAVAVELREGEQPDPGGGSGAVGMMMVVMIMVMAMQLMRRFLFFANGGDSGGRVFGR